MMKTTIFLGAILAWLAWLPAQAAECENGESAGYACSHIDFVGHLSPADMGGDGEVLNDIWGWVDPATGEEYAIVGMQDGTAFVRIEDDGTLVFIGRLPASDGKSSIAKSGASPHLHKRCHDDLCGEEDSAWRDIKVYGNHAYIVSEAASHGLQIFDLTALATVVPPYEFVADESESYYSYYSGIGHAHNLFINEDTARAYIVGHDSIARAGGLHILDISIPDEPEFLGEVNGDGYTHDVQCVVYDGPDSDIATGSEICFASNEDTLTIWDVTGANADNAVLLSRTTYSGVQYTHQGWLSEDHRYFFLNDEVDELETGERTHLRVFDVGDLDAPELVADYFAPTLAIDHNNYVHGDWLYQSNYGAGLRILDISNPLHPVEAAYFDPQSTDLARFYGTWSNYLFPSGRVAFSDIYGGLYVVAPTISGTADVSVALNLLEDAIDAGNAVPGELTVSNAMATDATDVLLTLHLPAGHTVIEIAPPSGWTCEASAEGRVIPCRKPQLAAGSEEEFLFTVRAENAGNVKVIAMAYAGEEDATPADNLDAATLKVEAPSAPPPSPAPRSDGGGALAWLLGVLALAGGFALHSRRRRR
ncbi:MAG TPA: choice-of-anchor B family protein [Gammaproteobacteria bacterium]